LRPLNPRGWSKKRARKVLFPEMNLFSSKSDRFKVNFISIPYVISSHRSISTYVHFTSSFPEEGDSVDATVIMEYTSSTCLSLRSSHNTTILTWKACQPIQLGVYLRIIWLSTVRSCRWTTHACHDLRSCLCYE